MEPDFCICDSKGTCLWCLIGKAILREFGREGIAYLKDCFGKHASRVHHGIVDEALNSGDGTYRP